MEDVLTWDTIGHGLREGRRRMGLTALDVTMATGIGQSQALRVRARPIDALSRAVPFFVALYALDVSWFKVHWPAPRVAPSRRATPPRPDDGD
jgi:hypothetical protein